MKTMLDGILSVLKELEVRKVIIGMQGEDSEQYQEFCNIIKEKQIPVDVVKKGDIIKVEENIEIRVLFPGDELIIDNILNNNSLVFKLEYKEFKMLFTGDIEKVTEETLLKMYKSNELNSNVLKVAHHGSKSSSTEKFLEEVDASIALIGVGENNKFGHPNDDVLSRLQSLRSTSI